MQRRLLAEAIGTAWLVLGGCGAAVLAGHGIGTLGISFAFGLTVLTMAYAIGPVSGCHLNPAVTIGLAVAGRFPGKDVVPYIIAQVVGALVGAFVIYEIASGIPGFTASAGFAANGVGAASPGSYSFAAGFGTEVVMTFFFLMIILGATARPEQAGFAPIAIGLGLALVHMISIPVTNTSVNPARSTSQAVFAGGIYLEQLWIFWVAPAAGAVIAGLVGRTVFSREP